MREKIGVIGHFGFGKKLLNGQTVRSLILVEELQKKYGKDSIFCVDTYDYRRRFVSILFNTAKCIMQCKRIVIVLSRNGCSFYYPILYYSSKLFGTRVFNNLIGGGNVELYKDNPKHIKYCRNYVVNWAQGSEQVKQLVGLGLTNTKELPNMKPLRIIGKDEIEQIDDGIYRFCTFSRISKEKGIEDAIRAVETINNKYNKIVATLDIYGQADKDYEETFKKIMKSVPEYVQYKGYVDYDKTTDVLSKYSILLFPTTFYGEGFPGTIIDAYAAGLPTIATNWHTNPEVVKEGITGYLYDYDKPELLPVIMEKAMDNPKLLNEMKRNCITEAKKYTPEKILPIIFSELDRKED